MTLANKNHGTFFVAGAMLSLDTPCYVMRPADDELLTLTLAGQYCYVFTPPQMGKSSLAIRAASLLRDQGQAAAIIYASGLGTNISPELWYLGLAMRLATQLKVDVDVEAWWEEQAALPAGQRFTDFLRHVVLSEITESIVIFVDELESLLDLDFLEAFLTLIRSAYDARSTDSAYNRLTFALLGRVAPADLSQDHSRSPLTVAERVELNDFSREEATVLFQGLKRVLPDQAETIFARVFQWTNGHPYLTQKLCLQVVQAKDRRWTEDREEEWVDWLAERTFLLSSAGEEPVLEFARSRLEHSPRRRRLMGPYRQIYTGKDVADDPKSLPHAYLKLFGLVRAEQGLLKVRNRVYRQTFDLDWIRDHTAVNWLRPMVAVLTLVILIVAGVAGVSAYQQQRQVAASQAETLVGNFEADSSPAARLYNLAGLFELPGYDRQAQQLFYTDLTAEERVALFSWQNPRTIENELITIIKGVYTSPHLEDDEGSSRLLAAMVQQLRQLDYSASPGVVDLELELTQWLRGRQFRAEGQYRQAVDAYNYAISLNGRHPAIYFERGLVYAERGEPSQALSDLAAALNLNVEWQPRVQQVLFNNGELYTALWDGSNSYQTLARLVPTPTPTPTPVNTSTPSPTPLLTNTPAPASPTPTAAPTSTPTPPLQPIGTQVVLEPTPTPDISEGSFTLLKPISLDDPSYGATDFEWTWSGNLPPGYGFEVRAWRSGEQPAGVHNAVLDNQNGRVEHLGGNRYHLTTNIREAASVRGRSGEYLWTVLLVKVSPEYENLKIQAEPARFRFEAGGTSGGGKDDQDGGGKSGGGSIGID